MKDKEWVIYGAFGLVPVVWLALLVAPCMKDGLVSAMELIPEALASPFAIKLSDESLKWAAIAIAAYLMGIGIYFSTRRNYRRGEEMGSAKWGDAAKLNKRYAAVSYTHLDVYKRQVYGLLYLGRDAGSSKRIHRKQDF